MSGYPFSVTSPSSPSPAASSADAKLLAYGKDVAFKDGDFVVAKDGDWATVEGLEMLRAAVYRRLITRPGEFKARPGYGVGLALYLYEAKTPTTLAALSTTIRTQLLQDRRIEDVSVALEDLTDSPGLKVGIKVTARGRRLDLGEFVFAVP